MDQAAQNRVSVTRTADVGIVRALLDLTKVRITGAVTLTTVTGYLMAMHAWSWNIIYPLLGTFLLASGASALNEWQEAHLDARMRRTRARPIPAGAIDPTVALFVAVFLMLIGLYTLTSNPVGQYDLFVLGLLAVFWYNGVYTYLKRITPFAVVPGSVIGAIPPIIGYVAAGGMPFDAQILLVASFFFIWQIPHFWLLLLMIGDEYHTAGLPTLSDVFSRPQLQRVTTMWIIATAAAGLAFAVVRSEAFSLHLPWNALVVLASVWLIYKAAYLMVTPTEKLDRKAFLRAFMQINLYALAIMVILSANAVMALPG